MSIFNLRAHRSTATNLKANTAVAVRSGAENAPSQKGWDSTDSFETNQNQPGLFGQPDSNWMTGISNSGSPSKGQRVLDENGVGHNGNGVEFDLGDAFSGCLSGVESGADRGWKIGGAVGGLTTLGIGAPEGAVAGAIVGGLLGCPIGIGLAFEEAKQDSEDGSTSECSQESSSDSTTETTSEDSTAASSTDATDTDTDTASDSDEDSSDEDGASADGNATNPDDERVCGDVETLPLGAEDVEQAVDKQNLGSRILTTEDVVNDGGEAGPPNNLDSNTGHDRGQFIDYPRAGSDAGEQVAIKPQKQFFLIDPQHDGTLV